MHEATTNIQYIKGVGPKRKEKLENIGIFTILDLLYYFPREYKNYVVKNSLRETTEGELVALTIIVLQKQSKVNKGKQRMVSFLIEDQTGYKGKMTFFNQSYLTKNILIGNNYFIYGTVKIFGKERTLTNPQIIRRENQKNNIIEPVYSQKKGIKQFEIEKLLKNINIDELNIQENLPLVLRNEYKLLGRKESLLELHFPSSFEKIYQARKRMVFEEFFFLQLAIFYNNSNGELKGSLFFEKKDENSMDTFFKTLPFSLTKGQTRVWHDIYNDMISGKAMNRLVQGDVGSGKTVIALAAMYFATLNGYQSALMAPTEILAIQHYQGIAKLIRDLDINLSLLVGNMNKKEKDKVLKDLKSGEIDFLIGTHALIQDTVQFKKLGLTITDEQHRFGVKQRERLRNKNENSHTLFMSATPIPRTLALTWYGDLDISVIDTLPPGRQPVKTIPITSSQVHKSYEFIRKELASGRQVYFVCPLIEENEDLELDAVQKVYKQLSEKIFPEYKCSLLHGKMNSKEKDMIMKEFYSNSIQILVSTTVVEVGVNVPNASIIFIYNAERFGLAQLHQLRGRVGRGSYKSYCILYNTGVGEKNWKRMQIMQNSNDGFYIAEKDLELRGSGDFFGTRQHGLPEFKIADLVQDQTIFLDAQKEARRFHRRFPWENLPDNPIKQTLLNLYKEFTS